jgi:hypothetical protein
MIKLFDSVRQALYFFSQYCEFKNKEMLLFNVSIDFKMKYYVNHDMQELFMLDQDVIQNLYKHKIEESLSELLISKYLIINKLDIIYAQLINTQNLDVVLINIKELNIDLLETYVNFIAYYLDLYNKENKLKIYSVMITINKLYKNI